MVAMVMMMMILRRDILRKTCYQINLTPLALYYTSPSCHPSLHQQTKASILNQTYNLYFLYPICSFL